MLGVTCPRCRGGKKVFMFIDGHTADGKPYADNGWHDCLCCGGTGEISREKAARIKLGEAARAARLEKFQSLREAARERGISPAELSRIERGEGPPDAYR